MYVREINRERWKISSSSVPEAFICHGSNKKKKKEANATGILSSDPRKFESCSLSLHDMSRLSHITEILRITISFFLLSPFFFFPPFPLVVILSLMTSSISLAFLTSFSSSLPLWKRSCFLLMIFSPQFLVYFSSIFFLYTLYTTLIVFIDMSCDMLHCTGI